MQAAPSTAATARREAEGRAWGPALGVVVLLGAAFVAGSLWPWRQLVGAAYLVRFAAFAAALCAVSLAVAAALGRLGRRRGAPGAGLATAASLAVLLPAWAWNDNGDIDVILLHLDSLRADHCSAWGYARETTPHLEALADRGVRFERFFAQSAGTDKSTPAMLASIHPSMFCDLDAAGDGFVIPERFPLLSERLAALGWRCWAFSSNPQVNASRGYARGFEALEAWWKPSPRPHELMARLRTHLQGSGAERHFVFGLVLDPHMPYTPDPRFDLWRKPGSPDYETLKSMNLELNVPRASLIESVIDLYDGEVREVDDALGGLLDWLAASGRMERTLLLVVADHGDKFLEHGEFGHSGLLYDDVMHVPLVASFPSPLRFPRLLPDVRIYPGLASHVDLLPTVLSFVGAATRDDHVRGRDLVPFLYGKEPVPEGDVFSEELIAGLSVRALRTGTHKAMVWRLGGEPEQMALFDLVADPQELEPIGPGAGGEDEDRLLALRAEIERRVAEARSFWQAGDGAPLDEATREALGAIGYTH